MKKLAIIVSHPIQYYAPVFALLAKKEGITLKVFYTWEKNAAAFDRDFGKNVAWDIPLLEGYEYSFVSNAGNSGRGFWQIKNLGLIKEIETWQSDTVLVIGWNYRSHLRAMFHFKGRIPVLFRGDSTLLDRGNPVKQWIRKIFLRFIYRTIDHALYVGTANKAYFLQHGIRESQLVFTPHAIDNRRFAALNQQQEAFIKNTRQSLGILPGDTCMVFCGKIIPKKDPLILAEAVKAMNNNRLHLVFVGDGILAGKLDEIIICSPNIHRLPFQNQGLMPAVYRLGEIFCLPSCGPGETWGLAVNEAMACGRAILVSDKVGCRSDLLQEGINGISFRSGNLADLQDKINKLLANPNETARMGRASAAIINDWSFEHIAVAIQNCLRKF